MCYVTCLYYSKYSGYGLPVFKPAAASDNKGHSEGGASQQYCIHSQPAVISGPAGTQQAASRALQSPVGAENITFRIISADKRLIGKSVHTHYFGCFQC